MPIYSNMPPDFYPRPSDVNAPLRSTIGIGPRGPEGHGVSVEVVEGDPYGTYRLQFKDTITNEIILTTPNMDPGSRVYLCDRQFAYANGGTYTAAIGDFTAEQAGTIRDARVGDLVMFRATKSNPNVAVFCVGVVTSISRSGSVTFESHIELDTSLAEGAVTAANIADGAITESKLADNAVTNSKLADNAVETRNIKNSAVTEAKLANNAVTSAKINSSAVTTDKLADGSVTEPKLASNAVTESKIGNGVVTTEKLADSSVTNAKLANSAVGSDKLAANSVTESKLASNSVTESKIMNGNVTNTKLANDSVTTSKIAANAVTEPKLANSAVTTDKIAMKAVTTDKLADGAVTMIKIHDGAVTAEKLDDTAMTEFVRAATLSIFFGLTMDGYFCAYVTDEWPITFDTIVDYQDPNYGSLVIEY